MLRTDTCQKKKLIHLHQTEHPSPSVHRVPLSPIHSLTIKNIFPHENFLQCPLWAFLVWRAMEWGGVGVPRGQSLGEGGQHPGLWPFPHRFGSCSKKGVCLWAAAAFAPLLQVAPPPAGQVQIQQGQCVVLVLLHASLALSPCGSGESSRDGPKW